MPGKILGLKALKKDFHHGEHGEKDLIHILFKFFFLLPSSSPSVP